MAGSLVVRAMRHDDLDAIVDVQAQCYPPAMNEPASLLAARLQACPETAWVAVDPVTDVAGAYLVGYRTLLGKVSPLGGAFAHHPQADGLYLHDLAIGRALRGQGVAQALLAHARAQALEWHLAGLALVSVNDTVAFWRGQGFELADVTPQGQAALATYPGRAVYMRA
jgi:GNAT superfamily N-acetyltransferase